MIIISQCWQNDLIELAKMILPLIITFISIYITYRLALRQFLKQKHYEYLEKQIKEFYSPMVGCLEEIRAKSNVRVEVFKLSDPAWQKIVAEHPVPFLDHEKYFEPFRNQILYENKQFREELIPLYLKMHKIFTDNISLANITTRKWYYEYVRFVEIWQRWLTESIPVEVIIQLYHSEERLKPFYNDLEEQMNILRTKISQNTNNAA